MNTQRRPTQSPNYPSLTGRSRRIAPPNARAATPVDARPRGEQAMGAALYERIRRTVRQLSQEPGGR